MDLFDQMRTFVRIVETGRLAAAAKSRSMSIAAVSRQLAALEKQLGATLVARSTRQLAITDSGRRWYRYCVSTLSGLETAQADVAEGSEAQGTVVVSTPVSFGLSRVIAPLEKVARAHPKLTIELRLEDHAIDLLGDNVDIAVRVGMTLPDSASVVAHKLITFRRAVLASAAYLRKRGRPKHPSDLKNHALLVHTRASSSFTRWQFAKGDDSVEITPQSRLQSTSPVVLREWAQGGAGITLIPDWFAGDLEHVLTDWRTPEITAYAIHRVEVRGAARIRTVLEALSSVAR